MAFIIALLLIMRERYTYRVIINHTLTMAQQKPSSHLGAGLAAGAVIGLATGFFLNSRKGKVLVADAQKKSKLLQKQVMKMLADAGTLSEQKYEEIVDKVVAYYAFSKEIAVKEIPEVRKYLMSQWKGIESQLENVGEDAVKTVKTVQKKAVKAVKKVTKK